MAVFTHRLLSPVHPASVFLHEVSSSGRASSCPQTRPQIRSCTCGSHSSATWAVVLVLGPARTRAWPFNLFNGCIVTRPNEQGSGLRGDIRRRQVFMSGPPLLPFFPPSVGQREKRRGEKRRWPVGSLMKSTIVQPDCNTVTHGFFCP